MGLVDDYQTQGKDVHLVDMSSPIAANTGGLMRDSLHTNSAGNDVLAQQWSVALESRFAAVPEPGTVSMIGFLGGLVLLRRRRATSHK